MKSVHATGPSRPDSVWLRAGMLGAVALVYFLAARAGLLLASVHGNASPVWPATGIAIGLLLLAGPRMWLAVCLGAFAANAITAVPLWAAFVIALGNTFEAVVGAALVQAIARRMAPAPLAEPAGICVATLVAPLASASIGVGTLWFSGGLDTAVVRTVWITWYTGDALGALIITPALTASARVWSGWRTWPKKNFVLAGVLAVTGAGLGAAVFFRSGGTPFLFLMFPWLFAVSAAFRVPGAQAGALLLATISVLGTAAGLGPFSSGSLNDNLLHLQLFLVSVGVTAMVLPAFKLHAGWWLPAAVLLLGWALSGYLFAVLERDRSEVDRKHLAALVEQSERAVLQRLATYEDVLRGGVSLFATDHSADAFRWRAYVDALEIFERYPGIYGLGVIFPVKRGQELVFESVQREMHAPDFRIHPVPGAAERPAALPERYVITFLEPLAPNRRALGLEVSSEKHRLEGLLAARDSGEPVITRSVSLVQDGQARPGFLLFMPMYERGAPRNTVEQRRAAFAGAVYGPFISELFFEGVLADHLQELRVRVFDDPAMAPEHLVYSAGQAKEGSVADEQVTRCVLGGRTYAFAWTRGAGFLTNHNSASAWAAACAAIVSLLMAGLVMTLQTIGHRANTMVAERTEELATSEARTRAIIATALDAVVMLDPHGNVVEWNTQAEAIFGWTRAEALGRSLVALMLPERYARVRQTGFEKFRTGRAERMLQRRIEVTARDRAGREFPCELTLVPIRSGAGVSLSLFLRDISERKRAEAALREAKEAAEAGTRAKSDFLATMSHEIRTPMNGVIGFAQLLMNTPLSEQQREYAQLIQTSGDNLLELINGILDLSRIEAGKVAVENVRFNFEEIARQVVSLLSPRAEEKALTLALRYPQGMSRDLMGDPSRVRQVLINLVGNALKFTERGEVVVTVAADKAGVRIEVRDTGCGIAIEKQAVLFRKFSQVDSSSTRRFGGSGLGLAIAKSLVELMDGTIGLESVEGHGSVFWFTLRVAPAATVKEPVLATVAAPSAEILSPVAGAKLHVLLAEDNAINQLLARAYLEAMGCSVELAATGVEAVALTEREEFDGVLMDCHMPDLDGYLATRTIRDREQRKGLRRLGIVALTASAMEEDRQRCFAAGMDGHLVKPIQPEALREILVGWAREKTAVAG
jgi:PAS domain S-box-containing protein